MSDQHGMDERLVVDELVADGGLDLAVEHQRLPVVRELQHLNPLVLRPPLIVPPRYFMKEGLASSNLVRQPLAGKGPVARSEERRVGKERRTRGAPVHLIKE